MLKVLLAPHIPENLVAAPRSAVKNAAKLAQAAEVSAPSAFRFVRQLKLEGFLDERGESVRLVRLEELIRRWRAASLKPVQQYPMRWLIPGDPERQLWDGVEAYETGRPPLRSSGGRRGAARRRWPRACLALFAAAEALGYGFVHPAPRHLYLEWLDHEALRRLGLAPAAPGHDVDVFVRQPPARESVFRGAVRRDRVAVADIIQTWLDISEHPARGAEQAKDIRRRALKSLFEEGEVMQLDEREAFSRLVLALRPYLDRLVIVGGWAHRLFALHELARPVNFAPLMKQSKDLLYVHDPSSRSEPHWRS